MALFFLSLATQIFGWQTPVNAKPDKEGEMEEVLKCLARVGDALDALEIECDLDDRTRNNNTVADALTAMLNQWVATSEAINNAK